MPQMNKSIAVDTDNKFSAKLMGFIEANELNDQGKWAVRTISQCKETTQKRQCGSLHNVLSGYLL